MSKLGQLKNKVRYEGNVPRCMTCKHFREARILLGVNSNTFRKNHHCGIHYFTVTPNAVCNTWAGVDGSTLEATQ